MLDIKSEATIQKTGCIQIALSILGDKWTPLIIQELTKKSQSFSDLEKNLEGISPRTLSQRLNKLVSENIIDKQMHCRRPPRYSYSLTEKGSDLKAIISSMEHWSGKYHNHVRDC